MQKPCTTMGHRLKVMHDVVEGFCAAIVHSKIKHNKVSRGIIMHDMRVYHMSSNILLVDPTRSLVHPLFHTLKEGNRSGRIVNGFGALS